MTSRREGERLADFAPSTREVHRGQTMQLAEQRIALRSELLEHRVVDGRAGGDFRVRIERAAPMTDDAERMEDARDRRESLRAPIVSRARSPLRRRVEAQRRDDEHDEREQREVTRVRL